MRWIFLILGLFCSTNVEAVTEYMLVPINTYQDSHWNPIKAVYQKSTGSCYGIDFQKFYIMQREREGRKGIGRIEKPSAESRFYQLFREGRLLSKHKSKFDMGSLFDSLKKFAVYDHQSNLIGSVKGSYFTLSAAQFYFYDKGGEPFAIADLDRGWSTLTIRDMSGDTIYECEKHFHSNVTRFTDWIPYIGSESKPSNRYEWSIQYDESKKFDERFFWPFMAFIAQIWWAGQTE